MLKNIGIVLPVSLVGAALFAAGCGGSDDGDASAQSLDKATFAKRADAICEKASGRLGAEIATISNREAAKASYDYTKTQIVIVRKALIPRFEEELEQIRAIGVPPEDKKDAEAFRAAFQEAIDKVKGNPKVIAEGQAPYQVAHVAGMKIGVKSCPLAPLSEG